MYLLWSTSSFFLICLQVYSEYRASLAFDLVSSRQKNVSIPLKVLSEINSPVDKCATDKTKDLTLPSSRP
jgi:hypothetical protein